MEFSVKVSYCDLVMIMKTLFRRSLPLLVLALTVTWFSACSQDSGPPPAAGDYGPLPAFDLPRLDGSRATPADFEGQVLVLDFWATWCGPCRKQAEELEEVFPEFEGQGVQFLAVDSGEDFETVERFVEKTPFSYPVLLDSMDELSIDLEVMALPTVVIVDRDGRVVFNEAGIATAEELRDEISALL